MDVLFCVRVFMSPTCSWRGCAIEVLDVLYLCLFEAPEATFEAPCLPFIVAIVVRHHFDFLNRSHAHVSRFIQRIH